MPLPAPHFKRALLEVPTVRNIVGAWVRFGPLGELFPMRRSIGGLGRTDKEKVYERAAELAQAEGHAGIVEFIRAQAIPPGARFKAVRATTEHRLLTGRTRI